MQSVNMVAVRAFSRVMTPIQDGLSEAHACDRHFDGGEFSDAAHGRIAEDEAMRVAEVVGARFGLTGGELYAMCMDAWYRFDYHYQSSHRKKPARSAA